MATHHGPLRFEGGVPRTSQSSRLGCYRRVLEMGGEKAGALVAEDGTFEGERKWSREGRLNRSRARGSGEGKFAPVLVEGAGGRKEGDQRVGGRAGACQARTSLENLYGAAGSRETEAPVPRLGSSDPLMILMPIHNLDLLAGSSGLSENLLLPLRR